MSGEIIAEFSKCPACGSEKRFVEEMAKEMKDKGWMREQLSFFALMINGVVKDENPVSESKIPIGSNVPAYGIGLDVCLDCGCIYAVKLIRDEVTKTLPVKLSQPLTSKKN